MDDMQKMDILGIPLYAGPFLDAAMCSFANTFSFTDIV
jgi:hypothetical protein